MIHNVFPPSHWEVALGWSDIWSANLNILLHSHDLHSVALSMLQYCGWINFDYTDMLNSSHHLMSGFQIQMWHVFDKFQSARCRCTTVFWYLRAIGIYWFEKEFWAWSTKFSKNIYEVNRQCSPGFEKYSIPFLWRFSHAKCLSCRTIWQSKRLLCERTDFWRVRNLRLRLKNCCTLSTKTEILDDVSI